MRTIDWTAHRAHREQVMADHGQWIGLLDQDGIPFLMDFPQITEMDWPEPRGTISDIKLTLNVETPSGRIHPIARELVATNIGTTNHLAQLQPVTGPARYIAVERPGLPRRVMRVAHQEPEASAQSMSVMEVLGSDLRIHLQMLIAPSHPLSWTPGFTRFTRDWVGPEDILELFEQPRDLSDIKMFTVADGASIDGPADEVIFRLMSESLEAIYQKVGITSPADRPYVVVLQESEIPELPAPPPLHKSVSIYNSFWGWESNTAKGDRRLIEHSSHSAVAFIEDMVCDRKVRRASDSVTLSAGMTIPAGVRIRGDDGHGTYAFTTKHPEVFGPISASPYTILRPTDQTIWDEVGNIALSYGIRLSADMWWPGDPQPPGHALVYPTIVFSIQQGAMSNA